MKLKLSYLLLCLFSLVSAIDYMPLYSKDFEDAPISYAGDRLLLANKITVNKQEYIYSFSKNDKTADSTKIDNLHIEIFKKQDSLWSKSFNKTIFSDKIIFLWENRSFIDNDSQNNIITGICYSTNYTKEQKNDNEYVYLLVIYKNNTYEVKQKGIYATVERSENFIDLPLEVQEKINKYWDKLDKWD